MRESYARSVVAARWWVIGFWALGTLGSLLLLPGLEGGSGGLKGLLSSETPSVRVEERSERIFRFPLLGRTVLVQRDANGLSAAVQQKTVQQALALDRAHGLGGRSGIKGALPLTNGAGLFPGARESGTTALTYLLFEPAVKLGAQTRAAERYEREFFGPGDAVVGVTGSAPARAQQGKIIRGALPLVEVMTLLAIAFIVGVGFRSLVAPLVALVTAGVAFTVTLRAFAVVAERFGLAAPSELQPVVIALLLGIVTDYVVFFMTALRQEVARSPDSLVATRAATARYAPIVGVAGLAVVAGTAALLVARTEFFKALGPALVFTVLCGLVVAITLVPALMAVLGHRMFWPTRASAPAGPDTDPATARRDEAGSGAYARLLAAIVGSRRTAGLVVAVSVAGFALLAIPAASLRTGVSFVDALPANSPVRAAAEAAETGFAPGILSPTLVLLEGRGIGDRREALERVGALLDEQPGVAGVVAPGSLPPSMDKRVLVTPNAARILIVLDEEPLGAAAVTTLNRIDDALPALLSQSGLTGVTSGLGGDTAAASYLVQESKADLLRITGVALLANLLMLLIFLRAVVAPVLLLCASLLSLTAALGVTTLVFDVVAPGQGLTFYVPLAAGILLLAFGSDYHIFSVGQIWDESRRHPLLGAVRGVLPSAVRALVTAGAALAASFALLGFVPLLSIRQLALAVALGIAFDVLLVRALVTPALLRLMGPASAWPSSRLRAQARSVGEVAREGSS